MPENGIINGDFSDPGPGWPDPIPFWVQIPVCCPYIWVRYGEAELLAFSGQELHLSQDFTVIGNTLSIGHIEGYGTDDPESYGYAEIRVKKGAQTIFAKHYEISPISFSDSQDIDVSEHFGETLRLIFVIHSAGPHWCILHLDNIQNMQTEPPIQYPSFFPMWKKQIGVV
jgi:hypothetical protein